jgi:hypothetical protein
MFVNIPEMNDKQVRGQHTQEFKLEAVRLVKTGQSVGMTAKVLGIPKARATGYGSASGDNLAVRATGS